MAPAFAVIKPAELPMPPQAAIQIMRACANQDVSNAELASLASTDPVLTAELLRIVNSPYFGFAREIANVDRAISVLGHRALRNLVLCISVRDALDPGQLPSFDVAAYWEDTLRRAIGGRLLAEMVGLNEDDCFTACLLQDFGLLVMFYVLQERKPDWSHFIELDPDKRYAYENEVFGISHDQVSMMLAKEWNLPETFINAIGHHHACSRLSDNKVMEMCHVLHDADWLAAIYSARNKAAILQQLHAKLSTNWGLSEDQVLELLNRIPPAVEEAASSLGLRVDAQEDFGEVLRQANVRLAEENTTFQELNWKLEKALKERDELADALANELELAAEIQRSLLPSKQLSAFPVHGINLSARELSGDFYDFFRLQDGSIHFNLGDVSGKGITASLLMAKTSSLFRCLGKQISDPGQLMRQINAEICETSIRGMFVTMVAGHYNPDTGKVKMVNAGNPPALLMQRDGGIVQLDAVGPPLGIVADHAYGAVEFDLDGGRILMYSDGVTEGYIDKGVELKMSGLIALLESTRQLDSRHQVAAIVDRFMEARVQQRDDITIMMLEDDHRTAPLCRLELNARPEVLQSMRDSIRQTLVTQHCNKLCTDRLVLAVNEAVMNVIQHAYSGDEGGKIRLEIRRVGNTLIFVITDFACPIDKQCVQPRDLDDVRPGGLGVHFMHEIMDEVSFQEDCRDAGNILIMKKRLDRSCLSKQA